MSETEWTEKRKQDKRLLSLQLPYRKLQVQISVILIIRTTKTNKFRKMQNSINEANNLVWLFPRVLPQCISLARLWRLVYIPAMRY